MKCRYCEIESEDHPESFFWELRSVSEDVKPLLFCCLECTELFLKELPFGDARDQARIDAGETIRWKV